MKPILAILIVCFFKVSNSQEVPKHSLLDCKRPNCVKEHKKVETEYDSLSGLKIIRTQLSSGMNVDQFGKVTPKKLKSVQEVVASNGTRLKTCNSITKFRGDVTTAVGDYISFDKQQPGFYVYHAPKLFGKEYTERYNVTGNLLQKK